MKLRDFVAELGDETCRRIHEEYSELEAKGKIGDGALRSVTEDYVRRFASGGSETLVLWMDQVAKEVWRRYAIAAWNQRTPPKVKALVADVYCPSEGNRSFQSVFGEYVCERLGDDVVGIWLPGCNVGDDEHTTRPDFEAAEKFVQDDFTRRVHTCLEGYDD